MDNLFTEIEKKDVNFDCVIRNIYRSNDSLSELADEIKKLGVIMNIDFDYVNFGKDIWGWVLKMYKGEQTRQLKLYKYPQTKSILKEIIKFNQQTQKQ